MSPDFPLFWCFIRQSKGRDVTVNNRMQSFSELACAECGKVYNSASLMLQHFAEHTFEISQEKSPPRRSTIPDLHPINLRKNKIRNEDQDLEIEIPVDYCEIAIIEGTNKPLVNEEKEFIIDNKPSSQLKRFKCMYCTKSFGWSTDLKRHILVHTGEKPFKCDYCLVGFTRNFLLQKHLHRMHNNNGNVDKINIPDLKPISAVRRLKPRKQDKCKIKKNPVSLISV